MTGTSSSRRSQLLLLGVALGAFLLRVFPFFGPDGAWSYRVDYDEGVYFSAASWLLEGALPYRDFVFVHPPGMLLFLSLTSAWTHSLLGVDGAFTLSRWIAAALGSINVLLVARLVLRWDDGRPTGARWGAIAAAALYATYPELVEVERGPFLEPLLNLVCLGLAVAVVQASVSPHRRRWLVLAGVLGGLAVSIKLWAAVWVLGALWGVASFSGRRGALLFLGGVVASFALVVSPFALASPAAFVEQVGLFHLWRPPDGLTSRLSRFEQIFALRHLVSPVLAITMAAALVFRRGAWTVTGRVVASAWGLTLAAFFASAGYWSQYNAHLIASEAVLAGAMLNHLFALDPVDAPAPRRPLRDVLVLVSLPALVVSLGISFTHALRRASGTTEHLALSRSPLRGVSDCVFTFEPGWSLAAGRLPPRVGGALVIDNYGQQLLSAVSRGQRFPDAASAFAVGHEPLPVLEQCRYVVLGARGDRQLSAELRARFEATHEALRLGELEVWQLRPDAQR